MIVGTHAMSRIIWVAVALLLLGAASTRLMEAVVPSGEAISWSRIVQQVSTILVALLAVLPLRLRRRVPILYSSNIHLKTLAWLALFGLMVGYPDRLVNKDAPLMLLMGLPILLYVVLVVVQEIMSQPDHSPPP